MDKAVELFLSLSLFYRVLVVLGSLVFLAISILALVFSHKIFAFLEPIAKTWKELPGGWVLLWLITFVTAFPPVIGYSTSLTLAGFVYGFPAGWPIVATASVAGSLVAFRTSRGIFSGYVHRLVGQDKRFVALGQVLRHDGLGMLAMIRLCPLPYSLSNGFLSTIPTIRAWMFAAATAIATPKLAVHVFIGDQLRRLAKGGDTMSARDRAINYISIALGVILGFVLGLVIYKRTMARAAELALEEAEEIGVVAGDDTGDYADSSEESQLMRGIDMMDPDAAALAMDDDDISLWETEGAADSYRDSWDEEAAVEGSGDVKIDASKTETK
ncbi:hypothetical protein GQ53DRAFT_688105 [Thozetella sp. PMI_491]|nr:hypothetical protein GQ53DRAFT_688105 [Thozetella sp. PMI_491]